MGKSKDLVDFTSKINEKGDFTLVTDINVILNSWVNILLTPKKTYPWDPEYGSDLYRYVFEQSDSITQNAIINEVKTVLSRWDNRATIKNVSVNFFRDKRGFSVSVNVSKGDHTGQVNIVIDEQSYLQGASEIG